MKLVRFFPAIGFFVLAILQFIVSNFIVRYPSPEWFATSYIVFGLFFALAVHWFFKEMMALEKQEKM